MDIFHSVVELIPKDNVRVVHRRLRAPKTQYYQHIAGYNQTDYLDAAQLFVRDYLATRNDNDGVLGMVRSWEEGDWVTIEATLRYPESD